MELVYLWVKEYKNIKNQGFNFSPRFECEFDGENLTIDEKEDYVNIFPENINITAIVGENGSGKSSLLEFLLNTYAMDYNSIAPSNFILLYKFKDTWRIYTYGIKIKNKEQIKEKFNIQEQIDFLLDKYDSYEGHATLISLFINNEYKKVESRNSPQFFIENSKKSLTEINTLIIENTLLQNASIPKLANFFFPTKVVVKINRTDFFTDSLDKDRDFYKEEVWEKIIELKKQLSGSRFSQKIKLIQEIFKIKREEFTLLDDPVFNFSVAKKDSSYFKREYSNFCEEIPSLISEDNSLDNEFILKIADINTEILTFLTHLPKEFDIEIKDSKKSFHSLSFGERQLLIQIHTILKYILKKDYSTYDREGEETITTNRIDEITIFLDEFELGLHPNWQKKFINYFKELASYSKKRIHLIVTSHSPFLLSDLPKENVIFLEGGEQKHQFKDKQTFGANIHTLLSDGFFMSDRLMGEFAEGKIEEIKKFYETVKFFENKIKVKQKPFIYIKLIYLYKIKSFRHIQSIIGEPFLQTIIKNYLDELEILFNGKKEFLQKEIKKLQELEKSL